MACIYSKLSSHRHSAMELDAQCPQPTCVPSTPSDWPHHLTHMAREDEFILSQSRKSQSSHPSDYCVGSPVPREVLKMKKIPSNTVPFKHHYEAQLKTKRRKRSHQIPYNIQFLKRFCSFLMYNSLLYYVYLVSLGIKNTSQFLPIWSNCSQAVDHDPLKKLYLQKYDS